MTTQRLDALHDATYGDACGAVSRRQLIARALFGGGLVGLRSLASGFAGRLPELWLWSRRTGAETTAAAAELTCVDKAAGNT